MSEQEIGIANAAGGIVVTPEGDIDMHRSPELRSALRGVNDQRPPRLVVNLAKVGYMDSSGLATLVECMRTAKGHKTEMILCGMNDRVRAIFDIARLDQFFIIVPTVDDIVGS
ncbi:MAG: STAS domain-containing protein [Phycisphaeraceae bacterium]|nr:MAG: STAS domain-containing protein [Phycisphaeraceae bacterium]